MSKWIINGSGQFPTTCNIPNPNGGIYNVKMYVDEEENGKGGKALKVGQKCNIVQGLASEVRGAKVIQADIECSNGVIHVIDGALWSSRCGDRRSRLLPGVLIPDAKYCGV